MHRPRGTGSMGGSELGHRADRFAAGRRNRCGKQRNTKSRMHHSANGQRKLIAHTEVTHVSREVQSHVAWQRFCQRRRSPTVFSIQYVHAQGILSFQPSRHAWEDRKGETRWISQHEGGDPRATAVQPGDMHVHLQEEELLFAYLEVVHVVQRQTAPMFLRLVGDRVPTMAGIQLQNENSRGVLPESALMAKLGPDVWSSCGERFWDTCWHG